MNLKKTLFMVLIAVLSIFGITSVNALTINDNGKYTRIDKISTKAKEEIQKCLNYKTLKYAYFDF